MGPLVLMGMVMGHERLRLALLARPQSEHFTLPKWTVYSQSSPTLFFFLLLVAALATVALIPWWFHDRPVIGQPAIDAPTVGSEPVLPDSPML